MRPRRAFYRLHLWTGWLIGIPLLFWTVSGLWMVARPIEEVRGSALRAEQPRLVLPAQVIAPPTDGRPILSAKLEQRPWGPQWTIDYADGGVGRSDPATGRYLKRLTLLEARAAALAAYAGAGKIEALRFVAADRNPLELRRERPAWEADFDDGTHVFIDADSGALLAVRTGQWRLYDFMWGLHIMDLQTREDTHHPILIAMAALAGLGTIFGLVLLPMASRMKRKAKAS
ncbi:hypothetical protein D5I55_17300 [Chakrabartia godavariana]|nr:hypothetical protein D5I55_17300 [Chakrabartia godavariana]